MKLATSVISLLFLAPASAKMDLRLLDKYEGATCLDGTAGAYYIEYAKTSTKKYQLFFEGGGWCYNDKDCANRATGDLGSSKNYPSQIDMAGGVASANCNINPAFCDFNKVYMKYCDGNSFSGALDSTVHIEETDQDLHFRGHYILEAVLTDLIANEGMDQVTELSLTGCSAGGLSTFLHSDYVHDFVSSKVSQDFKYGATPISGFFLMDRQNVHDEFVMSAQMKTIFELSNATIGVHQGCIENTDSENHYKCNTAPEALKYIEQPIFVLDSSMDSWQSGCIMTNKAIDYDNTATRDMPNGLCSAAEGFEDCGGNVENCDDEQIYSVVEYQGSFVRLLTNTAGYKKENSGAFIYPCFTHCAGQDDNSFAGFTVDGVTMSAAVNNWWQGNGIDGAVTKSYLSQIYNLDSSNPNPTC
ncbi:hypothetical protein TrST_g9430 [Triparma strigata]|uniref:Pectin acetylesterase n=1 Tax=Triparma strigata TaxID=1606541 RepID=A0A9W7EGP9_9STRA|nr:hypothetical protein TrST_g9430 [Triparma strigata]